MRRARSKGTDATQQSVKAMLPNIMQPVIAALALRARRLFASRSGSVGIIFGLAIIPLVGVTGLAIDYSYMLSIKSKVDLASDAAAIAGITGAQNYIKNYTGTGDPTAAAQLAGQAMAATQFAVNTGSLPPGAKPSATTPGIAVNIVGGVVTSQVQASYTMPTLFMAVLGSPTMTSATSSTATSNVATFVNIFVVIDNSQSMGIGAEQSDQQIIYNASTNSQYVKSSSDRAYGCAIACHYSGNSGAYDGGQMSTSTDLTSAVRSLGATLRIDIAKSAISTALQQIAAGNINVAVFTTSSTLTQVYPLPSSGAAYTCETTGLSPANYAVTGSTSTTNVNIQMPNGSISAAQTAIAGIDLQDNIAFPNSKANSRTPQDAFTDGNGGTNVTNALSCLYSQLNALKSAGVATPGNGLTKNTPLSYVVFLSDGVQNSIREAQTTPPPNATTPGSMVIDYPYIQDDQPTQTFTVLNNCSTGSSCQETTAGDSKTAYLQAIDPSYCTPIKNLGYVINTLEVQYIIPTTPYQGNSGAAQILFPMASAITGASASGGSSVSTGAVSQAMSSCATSTSNYYSANLKADITSAANSIFAGIKQVQAAHLSH